MALKSTIFRATLNVSDLDRGHFAEHGLTLARHPSETDERMMVRILAFALHGDERLQFGRGVALPRAIASLFWFRLQDAFVVMALAAIVWPGIHPALKATAVTGVLVLAWWLPRWARAPHAWGEASGFTTLPDPAGWQLSRGASYVHICSNETIHGVEFHELPDLLQPADDVRAAGVPQAWQKREKALLRAVHWRQWSNRQMPQ